MSNLMTALCVGTACGILLGFSAKKLPDRYFSIAVTVSLINTGSAFFLVRDYMQSAFRLLLLSNQNFQRYDFAYHMALFKWLGMFFSCFMVAAIATLLIAFILLMSDDDRWKRRLKKKWSAVKEKLLAKVRELHPTPKPAATPA